jgi:hypothetical protein
MLYKATGVFFLQKKLQKKSKKIIHKKAAKF